jgi:hypothetical protein
MTYVWCAVHLTIHPQHGLTHGTKQVDTALNGLITLAFYMCSLEVRFTVECVFDDIFEFSTLKMTSKTHSTVKRTSKLHIQNASVIDPQLNHFFSNVVSSRQRLPDLEGQSKKSLVKTYVV